MLCCAPYVCKPFTGVFPLDPIQLKRCCVQLKVNPSPWLSQCICRDLHCTITRAGCTVFVEPKRGQEEPLREGDRGRRQDNLEQNNSSFTNLTSSISAAPALVNKWDIVPTTENLGREEARSAWQPGGRGDARASRPPPAAQCAQRVRGLRGNSCPRFTLSETQCQRARGGQRLPTPVRRPGPQGCSCPERSGQGPGPAPVG